MSAQPKYKLETDYLNSWVESGAYSLVVNRTISQKLRRLRIDLVDVNYVLRHGQVVRSDMLESRGLWDVLGSTADDIAVELTVAVISSVCEVELLQIITVERRGR